MDVTKYRMTLKQLRLHLLFNSAEAAAVSSNLTKRATFQIHKEL